MEHKVVVFGKVGVGKSSLVIRFCRNEFVDNYDPTMADYFLKELPIDDVNCLIDTMDLGSSEAEYPPFREKYIWTGDGFICVYSITSKESLNEITELVNQIRYRKNRKNVPIVIVGNKCDLTGDRQVSTSEGQDLANQFQCPFFETSSKLPINIDECFFTLIREIRRISKEKPIKLKKSSNCLIL